MPGLAGEELGVVGGVLPQAGARPHEEGVLGVLPPAVRVLLDTRNILSFISIKFKTWYCVEMSQAMFRFGRFPFKGRFT